MKDPIINKKDYLKKKLPFVQPPRLEDRVRSFGMRPIRKKKQGKK